MFRRLLSVGGFTLLSRITGFLRDIVQAHVLGAGTMADAFVVAFLFPNYFRSIFGEGTINPAFLPRYAALHARGEEQEAAHFANAVFSWQMAAQIVLLVIALVFMPSIVTLFSLGWTAEKIALATHLARITFPYLILTVVAIQLSAMLNAIEKFAAAAAWQILLNVAMAMALLAAALFPSAGDAAAWGVITGGILQLVFIVWAARRSGLWLRLTWPRWDAEIAEFFKAYGAVTIGASSVLIAPMIDTLLASFLPTGGRVELYLADRIFQVPLGVLGIAIGTVLLPEMSAKLAVGDERGSDRAQNQAIALSLLLTLPFAAAFVTCPELIVSTFFVHGKFTRHAGQLAAVALAAYGVGLPASALVRIMGSTFYARHDTMTPARVTALAIGSNIAIKVLLIWGLGWGIAGIALGTALGAWINVGSLTLLGRSRGLLRIGGTFWQALPPILLAGAMTALGALAGGRAAAQMMPPGRLGEAVAFLAAASLGALAYFATVALFRERLPLGRLARRRAD